MRQGKPIQIDGSHGEGGGQIVRTALALSTLTGKPFRIENIRRGRSKPGLKAQHLTAIHALRDICGAGANEVAVGSTELEYFPGPVRPGNYEIDIGTAGSIALLMQALFLPLMFATGPSALRFRGGTCGRWQAPVEYYQLVLLPYLQRFADLRLEVNAPGYFPKGGGRVQLTVVPKFSNWRDLPGIPPFDLTRKPDLLRIELISHASSSLKKARFAERQASAAAEALRELHCPIETTVKYGDALSAGSAIILAAVFREDLAGGPLRLGADALGERGKPAERVGEQAARRLLKTLSTPAPVDEFLSDQLIPFLALLPGSRMRAPFLTEHLRSNIYVVERFLEVYFKEEDGGLISV